MNALDTFLQSGRLPLIEREEELTTIERFHAAVIDGDRMRLMAVIGEAGVGKSALIDRALERLEGNGDVVLRLRAWSEGTGALGEQLREALRRSPQTEFLLRGAIEPTLSAALGALRRVIRLRPTLLVIEDVHLLSGEPLAELARAFEVIEEEPIGVVITGRTLPAAVEGTVLPWLEERLLLDGFDRAEIERLWRTLIGVQPEEAIIDALLDTTHGNALALRSGLRTALRAIDAQGLIGREGTQVRVSTPHLLDELRRHVDLLADGMIAHMNSEERSAAARLAILGEVFDRATALQLAGITTDLLDTFIARGTLASAVAPASPLLPTQRVSGTPLAFTHSLLHEALRRHSPRDSDTVSALLAIVTEARTLLSLEPIWHLGAITPTNLDPSLVRSAALGLADIAAALFIGVHHSVAEKVLEAARHLASLVHDTGGDENARADRRLALVAAGLHVHRLHTPEFREEIDALLAMTADPRDARTAGDRIASLRFLHAINYRSDYPRFNPQVAAEIDAEVAGLLARYPELHHSANYIQYLSVVAQAGSLHRAMRRTVDREASRMVEDPEIPSDLRDAVVREIYPFILTYRPEEIDRSKEKIDALERIGASLALPTRSRIIQFQMIVGNYEAALPMIDAAEEAFRVGGLWAQYCNLRLDRTRILTARDSALSRCEAEAERLIASAPEWIRQHTQRFCGLHLAITALLCGDLRTARRWTEHYASLELLAPYERALILLDAGDDEALAAVSDENDEDYEVLRVAIALALNTPISGSALDALREDFEEPTVEIGQALSRGAKLLLLHRACRERSREAIEQCGLKPLAALENLMEWFASNGMHAFGRPLLLLGQVFGMGVRAGKAWRARFNEELGMSADESSGARPVQIRICGTVEAIPPDGEPVPVRGARLRTLLGLMVAQTLLHEPLNAREFRHIAAGSDEELDAENARKTMNAAVVRLRDLIGEASIDTSGQVPLLDTARVSIDLLEADSALRSARAALRSGALQRAVRAVRRALAATRGEPPFPALYEEFFEALREDFEARLRGITVDVIARLLEERDLAAAEELAALALRYMPEDEEMTEMRTTALEALGRRADAERARIAARQEELSADDGL